MGFFFFSDFFSEWKSVQFFPVESRFWIVSILKDEPVCDMRFRCVGEIRVSTF